MGRGRTMRGSHRGGVPKRSTGADCKSAGSAFAGSNPAPSTSFLADRRDARELGCQEVAQVPDRSKASCTRSTEATAAAAPGMVQRGKRHVSLLKKHVAKKRGARLITRQCWRGLAIQVHINCGCSSMVEPQPSKLMMWVRFPSPAPGMLAGSLRVHCLGSAGEGLGG